MLQEHLNEKNIGNAKEWKASSKKLFKN